MPVTFQDKKRLFLVDTGTTFLVYDSSLSLGKPESEEDVQGPNGNVRVRFFNSPEAFLGRRSLRSSQRVIGFDMTLLRKAMGYEVYGILGQDFLREHIIQMDFDAGKLRILSELPKNPGSPLALLNSTTGCPVVSLDMIGHGKESFQINTGSNVSLCLNKDLFQSLVTKKRIDVLSRTDVLSVTGDKECQVGQGIQVRLGGFPPTKPLIAEAEINVIGLAYLSQFRVTFDFPNKTMYLMKGNGFGKPDRFVNSGLDFERVENRTVVNSVKVASPAAKCGIRVGDVILRIGDKSAAESSLFILRECLCSGESEIPIAVKRGEVEVILKLVLGK